MNIQDYLEKIDTRHRTGISREHSYRGDLQNLLEFLLPEVLVTNEPARIECGAPDYILTKQNIPLGYIEAKDLGADLESKDYQEQFTRYKQSLSNLIITNYLDFHLFRNGERVALLSIGEISEGKVIFKSENFDAFEVFIKSFAEQAGQTIKSASRLAEMMANKSKLLADVIEKALTSDEKNQSNSTLKEQMIAFKQILIHNIDAKEFSDIYAQTVAYGMFAARLHDPTLPTFTRQEAAELIPKTNPFLRKLFGYIAGPDIDSRILWIVEALADIFRATDVDSLLKNFGRATKQSDPIIHFYETFLSEYDPRLRKSRGVWYTPEPVVKFIVRAVDNVLKDEFGLSDGLASTLKTEITLDTQISDGRSSSGYRKTRKQVHKVQVLDPATGTGTFLAEVVRHIRKEFEGQEGMWSDYVEEHLIPRLNGFELLMASYAMAHLKLDLLLSETGYRSKQENRLRVYLTNSLEEYHPDTGTLWANWLSSEANEANHIKRDTPIMVVLGNPPYSGISTNTGKWITRLIEDYKYVDGQHFGERKHWLQDDYVKFIRFGEHFVEKNGEGILAYINNHSFLDNPTFRGMRWHLLQTFDKIYVIDLHGNSKKKEVTPDGGKDENVFDIQQGVSINIFVKTGKKKKGELAKVFHKDIFGKRDVKYEFLENNSLDDAGFVLVNSEAPYYFFTQKDYGDRAVYEEGFSLPDLMPVNVTGIVTARDAFVIDFSKDTLLQRMEDFCDPNKKDDDIRMKYFGLRKSGKYLPGDSRGWKLSTARQKINKNDHSVLIRKISYRPFDDREIYYSSDMVDWGREKLMRHFLEEENVGLVCSRINRQASLGYFFVSKEIMDFHILDNAQDSTSVFPLYLYNEDGTKTVNLKSEIVEKIKSNVSGEVTPEDIIDYIYAVFHSSKYRETYKEFLKIDFPRVPYPKNDELFRGLVSYGRELRALHLMESPKIHNFITTFPESGSNIVEGISYRNGKVFINETQYFGNVPEVAWNFYIGGYQPAQKWLKYRKGRTLSSADLEHYQKIIVALSESDKIMKEIDKMVSL